MFSLVFLPVWKIGNLTFACIYIYAFLILLNVFEMLFSTHKVKKPLVNFEKEITKPI